MGLRAGLDIGGTKVLALLGDEEGNILQKKKFSTEAAAGPLRVLENLQQGLHELLDGRDWQTLAGLGIAVAGFFSMRREVMFSSPNLPGWNSFPLGERLRNMFPLPLVIENDATAAAFGEYAAGAGRGYKDVFLVTLGTGIGGGMVVDGRPYRGADGLAAEIGHLPLLSRGPLCGCGNRGCLETLASGTAVAREGRALLETGRPTILQDMVSEGEALSSSHVIVAAQKGDAEAAAILERAAFFLGKGLTLAVNLLNPERIILGGGLSQAGAFFLDPVLDQIKRCAVKPAAELVSITSAELGEDSGAVGALCLLDRHLHHIKGA